MMIDGNELSPFSRKVEVLVGVRNLDHFSDSVQILEVEKIIKHEKYNR